MTNATATINSTKENEVPEVTEDELDALLDSALEFIEDEKPAEEPSEDDLEVALQAVEADQAKEAAYDEQHAKADPDPDVELTDTALEELADDPEIVAKPLPVTAYLDTKNGEIVNKKEPAAKKKRKPRKKAAPKKAAEPAAKKAEPKKAAEPKKPSINVANMKPSEALRARLGEDVYKVMIVSPEKADKADVDALLIAIDGMPKKVGKKFVNLFSYLAGKGELSAFIKIPLELLAKNGGSMTFVEIKKAYEDKPYTIGTASSHASQMKHFLIAAGICTKGTGYSFNLAKDSVLWPVLCAMQSLVVEEPIEEDEAA